MYRNKHKATLMEGRRVYGIHHSQYETSVHRLLQRTFKSESWRLSLEIGMQTVIME